MKTAILAEYIKSPVICACGGSYMVTADLIDKQMGRDHRAVQKVC